MKTQLKRIDGTLIDESDTLTLKELVVKNRADLTGANLNWADLARADLTGANLAGADLTGADLTGANLTGADLTGANLNWADLARADLDYSAWPLWCRTYNVKVDKRIAAQIAMHFCWLDCDDPEVKKAQKAVKKLAKKCRHWKERE